MVWGGTGVQNRVDGAKVCDEAEGEHGHAAVVRHQTFCNIKRVFLNCTDTTNNFLPGIELIPTQSAPNMENILSSAALS